ncbi:hypothetical protein SD377_000246 [Cronobacter turicensis]|nr:hypothetical protein [Cronobacter turicensis]EMA1789652.1 hypothetical protein [Cronobacter turicensis]EMA1799406.1 hypothetical protein [Cronobacter turicensis]EMA1847868.1 hypothetical protein [Cronobacter turicensis]EMA1857177.1 hypothetical protein [Cronobacter turicensis]
MIILVFPMVPGAGLEPAQRERRGILNHVCKSVISKSYTDFSPLADFLRFVDIRYLAFTMRCNGELFYAFHRPSHPRFFIHGIINTFAMIFLSEGTMMVFFTFVTKIADSLAWPALIIFILHRYKTSLLNLIGSLTSLKLGDYLNATFNQHAAKVAEQSEELPEVISEKQLTLEERLLELPPSLAILDAWKLVEKSVIEFIDKYNLSPSSIVRMKELRTVPVRTLTALEDQGYLTPSEAKFYKTLRNLRNEVVHGPYGFEPSQQAAENYIKSAIALVNSIENKNPNDNF